MDENNYDLNEEIYDNIEIDQSKEAFGRILWGITLTTITLNFWGLNYILSSIGYILSILGYVNLRKENIWFTRSILIVISRSLIFCSTIIINSTIFQVEIYNSNMFKVIKFFNVILLFGLFFCLWKALSEVKKKSNMEKSVGGAFGLIIWYGIILFLGYIGYRGITFIVIMLIAYISIIKSLFKISEELDEIGYKMETTDNPVAENSIFKGIVVFLTIGIIIGYLFFNSYPMNWKVYEKTYNEEVENIKKNLIERGFPEHILADISDEDIIASKGATRVLIDEKDYSSISYFSVDGFVITGIGLELPDNIERWKIFHHFQWNVNPKFYGTESIKLRPAYSLGDLWKAEGNITGHVLYDLDDNIYISDYNSLEKETYTYNHIFEGNQQSTDIFATFSMPKDGENHRGYLSYSVSTNENDYKIYSFMDYTHQRSWFQYPVMTAKNKMNSNKNTEIGAFFNKDYVLTIYTRDKE